MHAAITAVGADRPGIVAAVTKVLYDAGGNIEDSRMAILGGNFAVVLIAALPGGAELETVERALQDATRGMDLTISVRRVTEVPPEHREGRVVTIRVYGADRPGIVARVSGTLAAQRVNILDLATHVVEGETPVYVMLLEGVIPSDSDVAAFERELKTLATELGVDVSVEQSDAETL